MSTTPTTVQILHGAVGSSEWFTPISVISLVRTMFGDAQFTDVASSHEANRRIGAGRYFTADTPAEKQPAGAWVDVHLSIFCNPPGGRARLTQKFWQRFVQEIAHKPDSEGLFLSFSLDTLQTTQCKSTCDIPSIIAHPCATTFVFPRRLKYVRGEGNAATAEHGGPKPSALTFVTSEIRSVRIARHMQFRKLCEEIFSVGSEPSCFIAKA